MSGFAISGKAARALSSLLRPKAGNTAAAGGPGVALPDRWPDPWTVRWSQQNDCYVIYLPDQYLMLYWGMKPVVVDNRTPAEGLPYGWWKIDDSHKDTWEICLVINYDPDTNEFISAKVLPHGGGNRQGVLNIYVALAGQRSDGSVSISQFVTSTITIGLGGGCGEGGYPSSGEEEEKDIVTDVEWDENYCRLVVKRARVTIKDGHIIDWAEIADKHIETISHSEVSGA